MEDDTMHMTKPTQSTIFNTSVRGWIALLLTVALCCAVALIVIAPFVQVTMPEVVTNQLLTLFGAGFGAAVTNYFHQVSKEGQKKP